MTIIFSIFVLNLFFNNFRAALDIDDEPSEGEQDESEESTDEASETKDATDESSSEEESKD